MSRIFKALERAEAEQRSAASELFRPSDVLEPEPNIDVPEPSEEYERLKVMLTLAASRSDLKSVMLVSALSGEGVTTVTLGLANTAVAGAHHGVLVLEANFTNPSLASRLGVSPRCGLSEILAKEVTRSDAIAACPVPRLFLLGRGRAPVSLSNARSLGLFEELLADLRSVFDYVLLDCGSLQASPDSLLVAPRADGVVLVVQAERTSAEVVRETSGHLRRAGANLLGVVLNRRRDYLPRSISKGL